MVPTSVVIAAAVVVEPYFAALPKARTDVLTRTGGRLRRTLEIRCRLCCDAAAPVVAAASAATDGDTVAAAAAAVAAAVAAVADDDGTAVAAAAVTPGHAVDADDSVGGRRRQEERACASLRVTDGVSKRHRASIRNDEARVEEASAPLALLAHSI